MDGSDVGETEGKLVGGELGFPVGEKEGEIVGDELGECVFSLKCKSLSTYIMIFSKAITKKNNHKKSYLKS